MRLLHDGLPYDGQPEAMSAFLVTTLIVVAGTILFFFGLSGFLLKALQSARGLYWRGLNMVTMRQLAAKVNTVSFSMAVIAMILFLAITSVTTGMSLADTMNNTVERGTPVDYTRCLVYWGPRSVGEMNDNAAYYGDDARYAVADGPVDMMEAGKNDVMEPDTPDAHPFDLASVAGEWVQVDTFDSTPRGADRPVVTLPELCDAVDMPLPAGTETSAMTTLGGMEPIDLGESGYTITSDMGATINDVYNKVLAEGVELTLGGRTLKPVQDRVPEDASTFQNAMMGMNSGTIVLPDDLVAALDLPPYYSYLMVNYANGVSTEEGDAYAEAHELEHNDLRNVGVHIEGDQRHVAHAARHGAQQRRDGVERGEMIEHEAENDVERMIVAVCAARRKCECKRDPRGGDHYRQRKRCDPERARPALKKIDGYGFDALRNRL